MYKPLADKIRAFNFHTLEIDGNNMEQVVNALNEAYQVTDKPIAIVCNTVKGKGVSFMENQAAWHGKAPSDEQLEEAIKELQDIENEQNIGNIETKKEDDTE